MQPPEPPYYLDLQVLLQHLLTVLNYVEPLPFVRALLAISSPFSRADFISFHLLYLLLRAQVSTQILGLTFSKRDPWMSLLLTDSHSSSSPLLSELDSVDYKINPETGHKHTLQ